MAAANRGPSPSCGRTQRSNKGSQQHGATREFCFCRPQDKSGILAHFPHGVPRSGGTGSQTRCWPRVRSDGAKTAAFEHPRKSDLAPGSALAAKAVAVRCARGLVAASHNRIRVSSHARLERHLAVAVRADGPGPGLIRRAPARAPHREVTMITDGKRACHPPPLHRDQSQNPLTAWVLSPIRGVSNGARRLPCSRGRRKLFFPRARVLLPSCLASWFCEESAERRGGRDHVTIVRVLSGGRGDWPRRLNVLLPCDLSLFWFVPGAPRHPFHTYRLTVGDLCIGQPQLGDEIGGIDKIPRWSNPGISKVRGR
jgi:hypothetical protein